MREDAPNEARKYLRNLVSNLQEDREICLLLLAGTVGVGHPSAY